jgi:hypothetical protein
MARTEQRRYARLATRLDARVRAACGVTRVQVRDYCLTGLLAVPGADADRAVAARLVRGEVVELALDGGPVLRAVVAHLRRRYGTLRVLPLDRVSDPFGPEAFMRAFQQALDLPTSVRVVVFETFGEAIRTQCTALYEALNRVLAPLGASCVARPPRPPRPP